MDNHALGPERFYVLTGAGAEEQARDDLAYSAGPDVTITNVTDTFGMLVVAGPKARAVLSTLTDTDMSNAAFRWLSAQEITLAGVPVRALRVTYVGNSDGNFTPPWPNWPAFTPRSGLPGKHMALPISGCRPSTLCAWKRPIAVTGRN